MGNVYTRSYFPTGWEEWIEKTKMTNYDVLMDDEAYNEYVIDSKKQILEIAKSYSEDIKSLETDINAFIVNQQKVNPEIAEGRYVYDTLVGNIFCEFWIKLIEQPKDNIKEYFKNNIPKVEDTFYNMEKKYKLESSYPAFVTINAYKMYA